MFTPCLLYEIGNPPVVVKILMGQLAPPLGPVVLPELYNSGLLARALSISEVVAKARLLVITESNPTCLKLSLRSIEFSVNENNLAVLLRCLTYSGCWISVRYKLDHAVLTISDQVAHTKHDLHFSQSNCILKFSGSSNGPLLIWSSLSA